MDETVKLSTNTDVEADIRPKKSGVERGSLTNEWVRCTYEIKPKKVGSGVEYDFAFIATDDVEEVGRRWRGEALTRDRARFKIIDTLTKHIVEVATRRKTVQELDEGETLVGGLERQAREDKKDG